MLPGVGLANSRKPSAISVTKGDKKSGHCLIDFADCWLDTAVLTWTNSDDTKMCSADNKIRVDNSIYNSYQYRQFLQNNAEKIIELNRLNSINKNL